MPRELVLLVEDDLDALRAMAAALEDAGFSVSTATNVGRAVDALDAGLRPIVIVTDLAMPERDGWDLLKHLREEPELRSIPVVVISGRDPHEARAAADAFLQKPFSPEQLIAAVARFTQTS